MKKVFGTLIALFFVHSFGFAESASKKIFNEDNQECVDYANSAIQAEMDHSGPMSSQDEIAAYKEYYTACDEVGASNMLDPVIL